MIAARTAAAQVWCDELQTDKLRRTTAVHAWRSQFASVPAGQEDAGRHASHRSNDQGSWKAIPVCGASDQPIGRQRSPLLGRAGIRATLARVGKRQCPLGGHHSVGPQFHTGLANAVAAIVPDARALQPRRSNAQQPRGRDNRSQRSAALALALAFDLVLAWGNRSAGLLANMRSIISNRAIGTSDLY